MGNEYLPYGGCQKKKKSRSQGNIMPPNTVPRERAGFMRYNDIKERSNIKHPSLESERSLSSPPCLNLKEYNKLKSEVKTSTSQS
jgi:hypothetical protein